MARRAALSRVLGGCGATRRARLPLMPRAQSTDCWKRKEEGASGSPPHRARNSPSPKEGLMRRLPAMGHSGESNAKGSQVLLCPTLCDLAWV